MESLDRRRFMSSVSLSQVPEHKANRYQCGPLELALDFGAPVDNVAGGGVGPSGTYSNSGGVRRRAGGGGRFAACYPRDEGADEEAGAGGPEARYEAAGGGGGGGGG